MYIPKIYKNNKTIYKCKNCGKDLYKEVLKEINYPLICLNCNENMYKFEAIKPIIKYNSFKLNEIEEKKFNIWNNSKSFKDYDKKILKEKLK